ncbi:MAG TPA: alpha-amylase family protein [Luteimonas sp.]|nr:alpha-amylase family protein [Luteimonas sp.]
MWTHDAVLYQIDPSLFLDTNGDGCGDLKGIEQRLEYVRSLGASTIWLLPFYRSPFRDGGYDVTNHLEIDPRFGDVADFVSLVERAESLGLRVLVELVMQHTSDQHPWFQAARADRDSPYRDYYIWADTPPDDGLEPMFPGVEDSVWTYDEVAGQYYRHMFYAHEPDLDTANPRVREELHRVMAYWLRLGADGFRVDAVPFMVERAKLADARDDGLWLLKDMHDFAWRRTPGAILMGEADVSVHEYEGYFGDRDRLTHLLDFWNNNHLFLALAREDAGALVDSLTHGTQPPMSHRHAIWLRNHDQLDLDQLTDEQQDEVLDAFAPDARMRVYARGIRRRLAPMLDGNPARAAMAHALLISLPGTPVLRYGDEIGMGEDLSLPERTSVRTPMQWSAGTNGGFSTAARDALVTRPIEDGPFGYPSVNAESQTWQPGSLVARVREMVMARLGSPEMGQRWRPVRHDCKAVFGLRYGDDDNPTALLLLVNLSGQAVEFAIDEAGVGELVQVLGDVVYGECVLARVTIGAYGYRWLRSRQR